jgi:hypothetical protein
LKVRRRIIGKINGRKQPPLHRPAQVELFSEFPEGQGVQIFHPGASAQKVHAAAPELSSAGPGEQEPDPSLFDEAMDFIKEDRKALNFIDDDDPVRRSAFLGYPGRVLTEGKKN